jgi:hypothetical protein
MVAHSSKLPRQTARVRLCSGGLDPAYQTFASAALLVEIAGAAYAGIVPVERTGTNAFRLDVPNAPEGSILILAFAAVGHKSSMDLAQLTAPLTHWRACDDDGK